MLQQRTIAVKSYNNNKDVNIDKAMVLKFVPRDKDISTQSLTHYKKVVKVIFAFMLKNET